MKTFFRKIMGLFVLTLMLIPLAGKVSAQMDENYFVVKELGFKIPVEDVWAQDLTYTIMDDSAVFSSKSLNAISQYCADGTSGLGISKMLGVPSDHEHGQYAPPEYIKQFNGFFFLFTDLHDSCTQGQNVDLENQVAQVVKEGFQKLSLI